MVDATIRALAGKDVDCGSRPANRTPFHVEGIDAPAPSAPDTTPETLSKPLVIQFQLRSNPLAH